VGEKICSLELGRYWCQNDGLGEADTIVREGGRGRKEGGREGEREGHVRGSRTGPAV